MTTQQATHNFSVEFPPKGRATPGGSGSPSKLLFSFEVLHRTEPVVGPSMYPKGNNQSKPSIDLHLDLSIYRKASHRQCCSFQHLLPYHHIQFPRRDQLGTHQPLEEKAMESAWRDHELVGSVLAITLREGSTTRRLFARDQHNRKERSQHRTNITSDRKKGTRKLNILSVCSLPRFRFFSLK